MRTLGATHILDRNLTPEALQEEIRKITDQPFQTIFDAAGVPETQLLGYDLLASGGTLAAVRPDAIAPEKVSEKKSIFMWGDVNTPAEPHARRGAVREADAVPCGGHVEGMSARTPVLLSRA